MALTERLSELVRACFTGIWIESHEHEDALIEIGRLCREQSWRQVAWDVDQGLILSGAERPVETGTNDPLAAIRSLASFPASEQPTLLVMARQIFAGKQNRTFLVVLAPLVQIPVELEKLFVVVEHELPNREQLAEIARGIATEAGKLPEGQEQDLVLDAAVGLTRYEAEAAFSLSLVREGRITADTLTVLEVIP